MQLIFYLFMIFFGYIFNTIIIIIRNLYKKEDKKYWKIAVKLIVALIIFIIIGILSFYV